jgi:hypothetical protein
VRLLFIAPGKPEQNAYSALRPRTVVRMRQCLVVTVAVLCTWSGGGFRGFSTSPTGPSEALPWNSLPPPPLRQGIGDASMTITTNSPQAQAYFNQGLRLLHDFWYFEAYRAFKEAARLDPSAAMAYWGMAQALSNFPRMSEQAALDIEKAKSLTGRVTGHEQQYIRATSAHRAVLKIQTPVKTDHNPFLRWPVVQPPLCFL